MSAKRTSGREAPAGGPSKPRRPGEGAQPREPTERNGGAADNAAGSGQEEARAGEAGDEGLSPGALEEPREEEEHGEPLDRGHVCEDKGLDR